MNLAQLVILQTFAKATIEELNREMQTMYPETRMIYFNEGVQLWYLHKHGGDEPLSFKSLGLLLAHLNGLC